MCGDWRGFGSQSFRASVVLNKEDMASLLTSFRDAHAAGKQITPKLQVTAKITEKGISSAEVVGIGEPRKGTLSIGKAMSDAKKPKAEE